MRDIFIFAGGGPILMSDNEKIITKEKLMSFDINNLDEISKTLDVDNLPQLVEWLSEKDNDLRYKALRLLQNRSINSDDVYEFFDTFYQKLKNENSYQRSIGLILISYNARWDRDSRLDGIIDDYLKLINDDKPITVRQCIQSLCNIVPVKNNLHSKISNKLMSVDISGIKETMRKLILGDILNILILIRKHQTTDEI